MYHSNSYVKKMLPYDSQLLYYVNMNGFVYKSNKPDFSASM